MNTSIQPAKRVIEYHQTRYEAGTDANAIIAAVQAISATVPAAVTFSNIGAEGINPSKVTYVKLAKDKATLQALGLIVFQLPTVEELSASSDGASYMQSAIETALLRRVTVPFGSYLAKDGSEGFSIPASVEEFTTETESSGSGARRFNRQIWREFAKPMCDFLRTNGKLMLTVDELEKVLSNEAYAKTVYPKIPQAIWTDKIIAEFVSKAPFNYVSKNRETGVEKAMIDDGSLFAHWLATRSTATFGDDIDLSELSFG